MIRFLLFFALWLLFQNAMGQDTSRAGRRKVDSIPRSQLGEILVSAFEIPQNLLSEPAPVSFLPASSLDRFGTANIVSDVNTLPGIRMEQRSPSSYRFNIRGSSVQSPFGVRDVKIYYNGIPVTDPTGDTYLNQFSFSDFGNMELVRGSVGSAYGAGIGGTLLVTSPLESNPDTGLEVSLRAGMGSYGMAGTDESMQWGDSLARNRVAYSDLKGSGYRDHTASDLQTLSFESQVQASKRQNIDFVAHYADLYYQTPGALTLKEYHSNPKMARPAAGGFPSSAAAQAAVYQKNFFAGMDEVYDFNAHLKNSTSIYGSYTDFTNPTLRNYELRKEPHFGGRTVFTGTWLGPEGHLTLLAGMEAQQGYFNQRDFGNTNGSPDTLQTDYNTNDLTAMGFIEADLKMNRGWDLEAGSSLNFSSLRVTALYPAPAAAFQRTFKPELIPRIGLSKTFREAFSLYLNLSQGFSSPTLSELLPGTNIFNPTLQAEKGNDLDLGSRGSLAQGRLYYDIDFYIFNLGQSISERTDTSGEDYYVNAGGTLQHGLEAYISYSLLKTPASAFSGLTIWTSQDWSHFRYRDYQVLSNKFSGNLLPGVAPYGMDAGLDLSTRPGINFHVRAEYEDRYPVNDANSSFAERYTLIEIRMDWHYQVSRNLGLDLSAGCDNLTNQIYSLGDDINAAAGRYYNVAPGINYDLQFGLFFRP